MPQPDLTERRIQLVEKLRQEVGSFLTIVHGECDCLVGSVGSEKLMGYTALIPGFKEKLHKLSSLNYGQVSEI